MLKAYFSNESKFLAKKYVIIYNLYIMIYYNLFNLFNNTFNI